MSDFHQKPHGPLRSFGRIKSRSLKPRQAELLVETLPGLGIPAEGALVFDQPTVLEIGFGGGEHLVGQAQAHPDWMFLGVEPFLNGVASCLVHIDAAGVQNVRVLQGDARLLLDRIPDGSLTRVYVLFPDPWPKARHHKRRLLQADVINALAGKLKPGAELRIATDWADYADFILERALSCDLLAWTARTADDFRLPPPDHITTRYEEKRLGDCAPLFLRFVRI